uniref:exodeoxyribonuclease III n=1 Tax=Latimeria chalumnae TaxID=7897 RepID=H3AFZ4_LATCH
LTRWNVNGIHHPIKRKKILATLRAQRCDLAFIQETHLPPEEALKLRQAYYLNSKSRGTATLIRKNLPILIILDYADLEGRYNMVEVKIDGYHCSWCVSVSQTRMTRSSSDAFRVRSGSLGMCRWSWGGDFNEVMDPITDKSKFRRGPVPGARRAIQGMMEDFGLVDVWRWVHPTARDYTFYSHVHDVYSRIDMFLIPSSSLESVAEASIGIRLVSDHAPVSLIWVPQNAEVSSRRWRLNTSLLADKQYVKALNEEMTDFLKYNAPSAPSKQSLWEILKAFTRGRLIARASYLKKARGVRQAKLEEEIKELEKNLATHSKDHLVSVLASKKYELNLILTLQVEYAIFRTRQAF